MGSTVVCRGRLLQVMRLCGMKVYSSTYAVILDEAHPVDA